MLPEQIEQIGKGIVEHMKKIGYQRAEIHLIGGEPTMLGLAFFENCMPMLRTILEEGGVEYELLLVSNLLHNDILGIAKQFDRVSTSYEPETRFVSWTGEQKPGLERLWLEKVALLQKYGINLGVTTAMTKPVLAFGARHLLDWFYERRIKQIHFGFFIPEGDGLLNIATTFPEFHETSDFLKEACTWYFERRDSDPDLWVNPVESMLTAIHLNEPMDDIVCPIISGSMDIHWDGNAAPCLEAGGAPNPDWAGNVFTSGISGVAASASFKVKVLDASKPQKACRTCDEYSVCKSGCGVLFKFWDPLLDKDCPGFKQFIKHMRGLYEAGAMPRNGNHTIHKSC
jgi:radical SAM protein with 4Fe4S-binding SPASM domain